MGHGGKGRFVEDGVERSRQALAGSLAQHALTR